MNYRNLALLSIFSTTITACGGSSNEEPSLQTGTFIDSAVLGLHYETATQSGLTNESGEFLYLTGEAVTFSLGGITLGSAQGISRVTPLGLLGLAEIDDARAQGLENQLINILVFLQSLDRDRNPENGIDLTGLNEALSNESLNFNVTPETFKQSNYHRIVNEQDGFYQDIKSAKNHFLNSLNATVELQTASTDEVDLDGDGGIDRIVSYEYDSSGRVTSIIETGGEDNEISFSEIIYTVEGKLETVSFYEMVPRELVFTRVYEYDSLGNVISEQDFDERQNLLREVISEYDDIGNLTNQRTQLTQYSLSGGLQSGLYKSSFDLYFPFKAIDPSSQVIEDFLKPFDRGSWRPHLSEYNYQDEKEWQYNSSGELTNETQSFTFGYFSESTSEQMIIIDASIELTYEQGDLIDQYQTVTFPTNLGPYSTTAAQYHFSDEGIVIGCSVFSTGIQNAEHFYSFDEIAGSKLTCDANSSVYMNTIINDDAQIVEVKILMSKLLSRDTDNDGILDGTDVQLYEGLLVTDTREFDYDQEKIIEVRQTIMTNTTPTQTTRAIVYEYNNNGDLLILEEYTDNILQHRRSRNYQSLILKELP